MGASDLSSGKQLVGPNSSGLIQGPLPMCLQLPLHPHHPAPPSTRLSWSRPKALCSHKHVTVSPSLACCRPTHPSWLITESTSVKPLLIPSPDAITPSLPFRAEFKFLTGKNMFYRQFSKACIIAIPGTEQKLRGTVEGTISSAAKP